MFNDDRRSSDDLDRHITRDSTEAKTWLPSEVWRLMEKEMKEYRHDCQVRRIQFSYTDMAECVYHVLDAHGLIEHTP